jgi:Zn finger protein HypA/HybF involved in hydrogenase expression
MKCKKCERMYTNSDVEFIDCGKGKDGEVLIPETLRISCPLCKFSYYEILKKETDK